MRHQLHKEELLQVWYLSSVQVYLLTYCNQTSNSNWLIGTSTFLTLEYLDSMERFPRLFFGLQRYPVQPTSLAQVAGDNAYLGGAYSTAVHVA